MPEYIVKTPFPGMDPYLEQDGIWNQLHKRNNILVSFTHLIEVDLLRQGKPLPMEVTLEDDYRIIVSRSQDRPVADAFQRPGANS